MKAGKTNQSKIILDRSSASATSYIPTSTGTSIATTVQEELDHLEYIFPFKSSGIFTPPNISTSTGVVIIGDGEYLLFDDATYNEEKLYKYAITGQTFVVPNDTLQHYIIADYNNGSPELRLIDAVELINQSDITPILTVYNLDNVILYIFWDEMARGLANKLCHRLVKTERFKVQPGGLKLGEQATRILTISSGTVWYGACFNNLVAINSSTVGQEIAFWYHIRGVWTRTTTTTYNNSQYDDGTDLQDLLPNRYAVNWVYRGVSQLNNRPVIILGGGNYTLAEALESKQPMNIPPVTANFGILVGRIIIKRGDSTATEIDTLYGSVEFTSITLHNGLSGLQGGADDEYYHLTAIEYANLGSVSGSSISDLSDVGSIASITNNQILKWNSTYSEFRPSDTTNYTAGTGLFLVMTTFSFDTTWGDARYYTKTAADSKFETIQKSIVTLTSTESILSTDDIILCNGTFTLTLPSATGSSKLYNIKNIGSGTITLKGNLSETIDGELNQTINQWENINIIDGSINNWYIL